MDRSLRQNAENGSKSPSERLVCQIIGESKTSPHQQHKDASNLDSDLPSNADHSSKVVPLLSHWDNTSHFQSTHVNNFSNNVQAKAAIGSRGTNVNEVSKASTGNHLSYPVSSSIAALHMHLLSSPPISQSAELSHEDNFHSMMLDPSLLTSPDNRSIQQAVNAALFSLECDMQHQQGQELEASSVKCNLTEIMQHEDTNKLDNGQPSLKQLQHNVHNTGTK